MSTTQMMPMALKALTRDGWLLFVTRFARLFAYGSLSVILVFYLIGLGLTEVQSGLVLTLTLAGDVVVSLFLTTRADRIGRRRMLIIGAILMAAAGVAFAFTHNLFFLIVAGTIGVISPSGNEVGPFLSIEQAALSHIVPPTARTEVFAWYTMAGSLATALGALFAGFITQALQQTSMTPVASYRAVVLAYAALGILLALVFTRVVRFGRGGRGCGRRGLCSRKYPWNHSVPQYCAETFGPLRPRFLCGRIRGAKLRRVLVLSALWRRTRNAGSHFLLGERLCRIFRSGCFATCGACWSCPHDGLHAPAFECPADSCAADAESLAGGAGASSSFQHQPDGCPGEAIVYHGGGSGGGTVCCGRFHGSRTHHRCGD